jgi:hypothetical protein
VAWLIQLDWKDSNSLGTAKAKARAAYRLPVQVRVHRELFEGSGTHTWRRISPRSITSQSTHRPPIANNLPKSCCRTHRSVRSATHRFRFPPRSPDRCRRPASLRCRPRSCSDLQTAASGVVHRTIAQSNQIKSNQQLVHKCMHHEEAINDSTEQSTNHSPVYK